MCAAEHKSRFSRACSGDEVALALNGHPSARAAGAPGSGWGPRVARQRFDIAQRLSSGDTCTSQRSKVARWGAGGSERWEAQGVCGGDWGRDARGCGGAGRCRVRVCAWQACAATWQAHQVEAAGRAGAELEQEFGALAHAVQVAHGRGACSRPQQRQDAAAGKQAAGGRRQEEAARSSRSNAARATLQKKVRARVFCVFPRGQHAQARPPASRPPPSPKAAFALAAARYG